jgi:hypothetical protein
MNFRQFIEHNPLKIYGSMTSNPNGPGNTVGVHNDGNRDGNTGVFVSNNKPDIQSDSSPALLPGVDLLKLINPVVDKSTIESVDGDMPRPGSRPTNPIKITLKNGRKILMTFDEFKRAGGSERIKKDENLIWTLRPNGEFYLVTSIKSL